MSQRTLELPNDAEEPLTSSSSDSCGDDGQRHERRRSRACAVSVAVIGVAALAAVGYVSSGARGTGSSWHEASAAEGAVSLAAGATAYFLTWQAKREMCWDVWGDHAGATIQLWRCADLKGAQAAQENDLKWLVPKVGEAGEIRWAKNQTLCLDTPKGTDLQLWYCNVSPVAHIKWLVSADGRIHLAAEPKKCVDLTPVRSPTLDMSGNRLLLSDCGQADHDSQQFSLTENLPVAEHLPLPAPSSAVPAPAPPTPPTNPGKPAPSGATPSPSPSSSPTPPPSSPASALDCKWGDWAEWSVCSASCGGGQRFASRRHAVEVKPGGKACDGASSRASPDSCNVQKCPKDEPVETTTTTTTTQGGGGGWWFR